jgi:hypothetical protein
MSCHEEYVRHRRLDHETIKERKIRRLANFIASFLGDNNTLQVDRHKHRGGGRSNSNTRNIVLT